MKELFNKLSNLFSFGKEHRLVNDEVPDMSGPDDSNIDPLEAPLGEEAPDMSGPELEGEHTEEEVTALASDFKQKAPAPIAQADTSLKQLAKKPETPQPRELTEEEKYILDFEDEEETRVSNAPTRKPKQ